MVDMISDEKEDASSSAKSKWSGNVAVRKKRQRPEIKFVHNSDTLGTPLKLFSPDKEIEDLVMCVKLGTELSPKSQLYGDEISHCAKKRRRISMPIQPPSVNNFNPLDLFADLPEIQDTPKHHKKRRSLLTLPPHASFNDWRDDVGKFQEQKPINTANDVDTLAEKSDQTNGTPDARQCNIFKNVKATHVNVRRKYKKPEKYNSDAVFDVFCNPCSDRDGNAFGNDLATPETDQEQDIAPASKEVHVDSVPTESAVRKPDRTLASEGIQEREFVTKEATMDEQVSSLTSKKTTRVDYITVETAVGKQKNALANPGPCDEDVVTAEMNVEKLETAPESKVALQVCDETGASETLVLPPCTIRSDGPHHGDPPQVVTSDVASENLCPKLDLEPLPVPELLKICQVVLNSTVMISNVKSCSHNTGDYGKYQDSGRLDTVNAHISKPQQDNDQMSFPDENGPSPSKRCTLPLNLSCEEDSIKTEKVVSQLERRPTLPSSDHPHFGQPLTLNDADSVHIPFGNIDLTSEPCKALPSMEGVLKDEDTTMECQTVEDNRELQVPSVSEDMQIKQHERPCSFPDNFSKLQNGVCNGEELPDSLKKTPGTDETPGVDTPVRKTRSSTKIRKCLPKLQVRHTPMGLPKPMRVKKEEFSVEEIYLNKNFRTPTERKWETIFEFPKESKDGSVVHTEKRKKRRLCDFSTDPSQRKQRWKKVRQVSLVKGKRKLSTTMTEDTDKILSQKLFILDNALQLAQLSP